MTCIYQINRKKELTKQKKSDKIKAEREVRKMFKNQIQKKIFCLICLVLLVAISVKMFSCEYSRTAYVEQVGGGVVRFIDGHGNLWEWEEEENESFHLGEKVKLTFHNNHTDEIVEDDIILKVETIEKK